MADSRRTHVTDTNIWIDLYAGGIIHEAFQLPLRFIAPDVVIAELQAPDGRALVSLGLQQEELAGDEVRLVIQLASRYPAPSRVDLFALALAKARGAVLLTGDRHLRKAAEQEKVPVHGTLWILDELVRQRIVTPQKAARALEKMRAKGSRLPRAECERRLKKWGRRDG
jgi:rRNA-processing protein FCF1